MTSFNGTEISYDAAGNPLHYGGWDFSWQNGRQLAAAERSEGMTDTTLSYTYDAVGICRSKTYTVETYEDTPQYTVTFVADGTTVKTMTVNHGYVLQESDYSTVPEITGYSGTWQQHTAAIHDDVTIQAVYTIHQYTVTFIADGATVKTMTVNYGYVLQESDYPTVPEKEGKVGRWKEYTSAIRSNVSILASYYDPYHTVTFIADDSTVKTMTVPDGYKLKKTDYPIVPFKPKYSGAWPKYSIEIHRDIQIKAVYQRGLTPPDTGEIASVGDTVGAVQQTPPEEPRDNPSVLSNAVTPKAAVHDGQTLVSTQTVQHDYVTQNGKVVRETVRTNGTITAVLDFIYDESGSPFAFRYSTNGSSFTTYYYVLNLQGDVVKLINASGATVAEYTYNAWGEILTATGNKASINPLRYRGYYYDSETGFYYLQSRYYDPVTHRFINADSFASTGQGFVGTNMFVYCNNRPVDFSDLSGTMAGKSCTVYISDCGSMYDPNYPSTASAHLKEKAHNILGLPQYSESVWQSKTFNEKMQILQLFHNDLAKLFGIESAKISLIGPLDADVGLLGSFNAECNTIKLSRVEVEDYAALYTVMHETYHAYQYAVATNSIAHNEPSFNVFAWNHNYQHYFGEEASYLDYVNQPLEVAAWWFEDMLDTSTFNGRNWYGYYH